MKEYRIRILCIVFSSYICIIVPSAVPKECNKKFINIYFMLRNIQTHPEFKLSLHLIPQKLMFPIGIRFRPMDSAINTK